MKLSISQFVLEEASFAHKADFLSVSPGVSIGGEAQPVETQVTVLKGAEPNRAAVRVRVDNGDGDPQYRFVISYLAILTWEANGKEAEEIDRNLMGAGASMLIPFIRETIANLTSRGRFGPRWLAPINVHQMLAPPSPPKRVARRKRKKTG